MGTDAPPGYDYVTEITGPLFLNLAEIVLRYLKHQASDDDPSGSSCFDELPTEEERDIIVESKGYCDVLTIPAIKIVRTIPVTPLGLKQRCLARHHHLIRQLSREVLHKVLFPSALAFHFLHGIPLEVLQPAPVVLLQGTVVEFDVHREDGGSALILLRGLFERFAAKGSALWWFSHKGSAMTAFRRQHLKAPLRPQ
jgi:hypothetical protein